MKLAKFWARASARISDRERGSIEVTARGWSNESLSDAERDARTKAARLADRLSSDSLTGEHYPYPSDQPLAEPVLRKIGSDRDLDAVVTRNGYGALVLNTKALMFIDIDLDIPKQGGFLSSLFGKKKDPVADSLNKIEELLVERSLSGRVYRTKAGLRVCIVSREFDPASTQVATVLEKFGSDPLYAKLCKGQECFRARLSPKPWRCGVSHPPAGFPFKDKSHEDRYLSWLEGYQVKSAEYATCELLGTYGRGSTPTSFRELVELHDRECRVGSGLPLG